MAKYVTSNQITPGSLSGDYAWYYPINHVDSYYNWYDYTHWCPVYHDGWIYFWAEFDYDLSDWLFNEHPEINDPYSFLAKMRPDGTEKQIINWNHANFEDLYVDEYAGGMDVSSNGLVVFNMYGVLKYAPLTDTSDLTTIAIPGNFDAFIPTWSPDGSKLAYQVHAVSDFSQSYGEASYISDTNWHQYSQTVIVPEHSAYLRPSIKHRDNNNTINYWYYDDGSMTINGQEVLTANQRTVEDNNTTGFSRAPNVGGTLSSSTTSHSGTYGLSYYDNSIYYTSVFFDGPVDNDGLKYFTVTPGDEIVLTYWVKSDNTGAWIYSDFNFYMDDFSNQTHSHRRTYIYDLNTQISTLVSETAPGVDWESGNTGGGGQDGICWDSNFVYFKESDFSNYTNGTPPGEIHHYIKRADYNGDNVSTLVDITQPTLVGDNDEGKLGGPVGWVDDRFYFTFAIDGFDNWNSSVPSLWSCDSLGGDIREDLPAHSGPRLYGIHDISLSEGRMYMINSWYSSYWYDPICEVIINDALPPPNDRFDDAILLEGMEDHDTQIGQEYIVADSEEFSKIWDLLVDAYGSWYSPLEVFQWYKWVAPTSGVVTVDAFGSYYINDRTAYNETSIAAFTGTSLNSLEMITGIENIGTPTQIFNSNQQSVTNDLNGFDLNNLPSGITITRELNGGIGGPGVKIHDERAAYTETIYGPRRHLIFNGNVLEQDSRNGFLIKPGSPYLFSGMIKLADELINYNGKLKFVLDWYSESGVLIDTASQETDYLTNQWVEYQSDAWNYPPLGAYSVVPSIGYNHDDYYNLKVTGSYVSTLYTGWQNLFNVGGTFSPGQIPIAADTDRNIIVIPDDGYRHLIDISATYYGSEEVGIAFGSVSSSPVNLVSEERSSFESGLADWTDNTAPYDRISQSSERATDGTYSMKYIADDINQGPQLVGDGITNKGVPVVEGKYYDISFDIYTTLNYAYNMWRIVQTWWDASFNLISTQNDYSSYVPGNTWTNITAVTLQSPANAAWLSLDIEVYNLACTFWIDNVQVIDQNYVSDLTPILDEDNNPIEVIYTPPHGANPLSLHVSGIIDSPCVGEVIYYTNQSAPAELLTVNQQGIETDLTGFSNGTFSRDTVYHSSGVASLKISPSSGAYIDGPVSGYWPSGPSGTKYIFTAKDMKTVSQSAWYRVQFRYYDENFNYMYSTYSPYFYPTQNIWVQHSHEFDTAYSYFTVQAYTGSYNVYLDELSLVEGTMVGIGDTILRVSRVDDIYGDNFSLTETAYTTTAGGSGYTWNYPVAAGWDWKNTSDPFIEWYNQNANFAVAPYQWVYKSDEYSGYLRFFANYGQTYYFAVGKYWTPDSYQHVSTTINLYLQSSGLPHWPGFIPRDR